MIGTNRNTYGDPPSQDPLLDKSSRAWAVFPLHQHAKSPTDLEIVDLTWAVYGPGKIDIAWWIMPNKAFLWLHFPGRNGHRRRVERNDGTLTSHISPMKESNICGASIRTFYI